MNYLRFCPRAATLLCSEFHPETYSGCSFSTSLSSLHHRFSSLNWIVSICCYFSHLKKNIYPFLTPFISSNYCPKEFSVLVSFTSPLSSLQSGLSEPLWTAVPWPRPAVTSVLLHVAGPSWSSPWDQQLQQHWPSWSYPFPWGSSFSWLPGNVFLVSHLS